MFLPKKILKYGLLTVLLFQILSCDKESKIRAEISAIPIKLEIRRFDQLLANSDVSDLPGLKEDFPFLFDPGIPDSIWIDKLRDPLQKELLQEVSISFKEFGTIEKELKDFYRHLKFYNPQFREPEILTLTNDVDYRNNIIVTDSLVLIALDNYLGSEHRFYENISRFLAANMRSEQIVSDLSQIYAERSVVQSRPRTFLDEMIYQGKQLYFKDVMLPFKSDASKIGYSEEQMKWALENEASIWSYFIEKELLYSTDSKLNSRFINPAPYSKFYLELDNESPGRIGVYMGWQIVRAYADTSGEDWSVIMRKPAEELFRESKFKPRK
jgi:gliding motility-associated lipoprotein GldB